MHLEETDLELYSMKTLPEERIEPFEEHLLECEVCQDRLLETDVYINAVCSVSPKLRRANRQRWRDRLFAPRPTWVAAFAFGVALLSVGRIWLVAPHGTVEFATILLQSSRGIEGLTAATGNAGRPLALSIDVTELPALPSYRSEIVNAAGKPVWQQQASPHEGRISLLLSDGLREGRYYARLYAKDGKMLREFGLRIK